jgi:hypothetical protein
MFTLCAILYILSHGILSTISSYYTIINPRRRIKNMATDVEAQLKQLDIEMKKAKTQAEKDEIKERQDELKRQQKK